ncbi:MAG TPA: hypothetical protein VHY75_14195 [Steroidobacteraceae bacterium]|jgi:hypothetical protein|nr:hypothetical protein [Steroidobacteraceae bacterium]
MSDLRARIDPRKVAANRDGGRRRFFAGLAVVTLIRASEAMAADQSTGVPVVPESNPARPPLPIFSQPFEPHPSSRAAGAAILEPTLITAPYGKWELGLATADTVPYSSTEFRPRRRSPFETDPPPAPGDNLEFDKPLWERLPEYRTHNRVRVLTLWESAVSAVSIQTDRKGGPSLQWTSRWMNRGGATRGLLDRWMPASLLRKFSHSASPPAGKPVNPNSQALTHPRTGAIP